MIYARNLHIDFLAKFTLRPPTEPDAQSVNLRAELLLSLAFLSANLYKKFARRAFDFSPLSIRNLRARFVAAHAIALYTAERLYTFLHVSASIFDFFPRALRLNSVASLAQSVAAMSVHAPRRRIRALFTRRCARILSKFYVKFQAYPHLHSCRSHKRSL